ncbi:hypothetical protein RUM43_005839 [Polyplax serrata]|uniref:Transmembrane protein n=1 Tax=Polyplax serrata TaxID=468196 RepID=A0AAN8S350_POLSC
MAPCENVTVVNTHALLGANISGSDVEVNVSNTSLENQVPYEYANCTNWNGTTVLNNCSLAVSIDDLPLKLNKFQIIKAVVLAGVTIVIMVSVCRMVFQLFVRYNVRHDR